MKFFKTIKDSIFRNHHHCDHSNDDTYLSVLTLNVLLNNDVERYEMIFETISLYHPAIICFQEATKVFRQTFLKNKYLTKTYDAQVNGCCFFFSEIKISFNQITYKFIKGPNEKTRHDTMMLVHKSLHAKFETFPMEHNPHRNFIISRFDFQSLFELVLDVSFSFFVLKKHFLNRKICCYCNISYAK